MTEARQPIERDLRAAGFKIAQAPLLLRDEETDWSGALPVLARHVERSGYPDLQMYRLVRMFARPEGLTFWNLLARCYMSPRTPGEQSAAAHALATVATDDHYEELVRFFNLGQVGGRPLFIEPIVRLGGDKGVEVVTPFADDPFCYYYVKRALRRRKGAVARPRRYARVHKQLVELRAARPEPVLQDNPVEWSTSLDLPDWKRFAKHLRTQLGGELDAPLGAALFASILSAPEESEEHVLVNTDHGVVRFGWYIGDIDVVDPYIFGSQGVHDLCMNILDKHLPDL